MPTDTNELIRGGGFMHNVAHAALACLSVGSAQGAAGVTVLILGIDRFMSECRSLTNFIGNAVATIVVSAWGSALDRNQLNAALDGGELLGTKRSETAAITREGQ